MFIQTRGEKVFDVFNMIIMILMCLTILIPFYFVLTGSVVTQSEYLNSNGFVLFPKDFTFEAYVTFFTGSYGVFRAYGISIMRVAVGTGLNVLVSCMLAYVISKKWLPGRNVLMTIIFVTMNFSAGIIPSYMVVNGLGLMNTFWAMILPCMIGSFYVVVLRNFFSMLPESLEESAYIDGANELTILFRIVIPLSKASIATIALFYAVMHWNSWFDASIYINNENLYPLQLVLKKIVIQQDFQTNSLMGAALVATRRASSFALKNTAILYTTLPILCVYPFVQKYFVKGMMIGSIKG